MSFWWADWMGPTLSPGQQMIASQPPLRAADKKLSAKHAHPDERSA
jgi:hypothetical protein